MPFLLFSLSGEQKEHKTSNGSAIEIALPSEELLISAQLFRDSLPELPSQTSSLLETLTHFLRYLVNSTASAISLPSATKNSFILSTLNRISQYTAEHGGLELSAHQSSSSKEVRNDIVSVISKSLSILSASPSVVDKIALESIEASFKPTSSILESIIVSKSCSAIISFGGQGRPYLDELRSLYYGPSIKTRQLIESCLVASESAVSSSSCTAFSAADVLSWLSSSSAVTPSSAVLDSAAYSYPLICVTQLATFYSTVGQCYQWSNVVASISAAAGHSQGVLPALVLSMSPSEPIFFKKSTEASAFAALLGAEAQAYNDAAFTSPSIATIQDVGKPSPMLSVRGLTPQQVTSIIKKAGSSAELSLINEPTSLIVSGSPSALAQLTSHFIAAGASSAADQSRVPFSKRKPLVSLTFLQVGAPFHCSLLKNSAQRAAEIATSIGINWSPKDLSFFVPSTVDGSDLRLLEGSLIEALAHMQLALPVNWQQSWLSLLSSTQSKLLPATHILDFGPGSSGANINRLLQGRGVRVVQGNVFFSGTVATQEQTVHEDGLPLLDRAYLLGSSSVLQSATNFAVDFAPRLTRLSSSDIVVVDTKFSRLLGKPPIMIAGMTPTTCSAELVAAVCATGYHVELAAGGLPSEPLFRSRLEELKALLPSNAPLSSGISVNLMYLNSRQWSFQFPCLLKMISEEGFPVESITVAAGVPSIEACDEIVTSIRNAGIRFVSFKPGTTDAIRRVAAIAARHPDMPIVLQWTSGRGGGHHSWESWADPILSTYASLRTLPNLVLVAGSGLGDGDSSWPYLSGQWSTELGYPPMPFDGVLFASRVMSCLEARTAPCIKDLIAATPGGENWELTADGSMGGIITIQSELEESMHVIANRAAKFWKELDTRVFAHIKDTVKYEQALKDHKDFIIQGLNSDYQKVYFPPQLGDAKGSSSSASSSLQEYHDLSDMTYEQVARRMVELMCPNNRRWLDDSYRQRTLKFLRRTEERLSSSPILLPPDSAIDLKTPALIKQALDQFFGQIPDAKTQILVPDDVDWFLSEICKGGNGNGKPVNFVPTLDKDLRFHVKKDSLWYSEDQDAIPNGDGQRCLVLMGPVAAQFSYGKKDEPVADVLESAHRRLIDLIGPSSTSSVEYLELTIPSASTPFANKSSLQTVSFSNGCAISFEDMAASLGCTSPSWLRALLLSPHTSTGKQLTVNTLRSAFRPSSSGKYLLQARFSDDNAAQPIELSLMDETKANCVLATATYDLSSKNIIVSLLHTISEGRTHTLTIHCAYRAGLGSLRLSIDSGARASSALSFYGGLWGVSSDANDQDAKSLFTIEAAAVNAFCLSTGQPITEVPIDYAIVVAWKPMLAVVLRAVPLEANLLDLVHLSNSFVNVHPIKSPQNGEVVSVEAHLVEVSEPKSLNGLLMDAHVDIAFANGQKWVTVKSSFLIRGARASIDSPLWRDSSSVVDLFIKDAALLSVLQAKPWWKPHSAAAVAVEVGQTLRFQVEYRDEIRSRAEVSSSASFLPLYKRTSTIGSVFKVQSFNGPKNALALIEFTESEVTENSIRSFLQRWSQPANNVRLLEQSYTMLKEPVRITAPQDCTAYAHASGDFNPIHVHAAAAALAHLENGPIVHGMWTSSAVRQVVSLLQKNKLTGRMVSFEAKFNGMVLSGQELAVQCTHIGMNEGRMVVDVEAVILASGAQVISARAELEQPSLALLFTGQGSAEVNMGQALYESSPAARTIWDRADESTRKSWGFSILDIVRKNPKELTIHFGGVNGAKIRENYISILGRDEVKPTSRSFTFKFPEGLLFATQFSQSALVVFEQAAVADLRARGVLPTPSSFTLLPENSASSRILTMGHSLGEFTAISSADVLTIEKVVSLTFIRGLTMQRFVSRDANGRSDFGMVAASADRISDSFTESDLESVVSMIDQRNNKHYESGNQLLQTVNYNIRRNQYVVAGDTLKLETFRLVLNALKAMHLKDSSLVRKVMDQAQDGASSLAQLVDRSFAEAVAKCANPSASCAFLKLERGIATVPLRGIDVPFHSRQLLPGVPAFRQRLRDMIDPQDLLKTLPMLLHCYIPNVVATAFSLQKSFAENVYKSTASEEISHLLSRWPATEAEEQDESWKKSLAYTLLIELLAYQFASPVRWIETQDLLLKSGVERVIEIGPAATLADMLKKTTAGVAAYAASKKQHFSPPAILAFCKTTDVSEICYNIDPLGPTLSDFVASLQQPQQPDQQQPQEQASSVAVVAAASPIPSPDTPVAVAAAAAAASQLPDAIPTVSDVARCLLACKLKKTMKEIPPSRSIKELVGGKSALQNEIVGELEKELAPGQLPSDGAADVSLAKLDETEAARQYRTLGKWSTSSINKFLSSKMPAGFGAAQVRSHLSARLPTGRQDGVLLASLTIEPASRLASESAARAFWDTAIDEYSSALGVVIPSAGSASVSGSSGSFASQVDSAAIAAALEQTTGKLLPALERKILRLAKGQLEAANDILSDGQSGPSADDRVLLLEAQVTKQRDELDHWISEHGKEYGDGIAPSFDSLKARSYSSWWAWAKRDLLDTFEKISSGLLSLQHASVSSITDSIIQRAHPELLETCSYLLKKTAAASSSSSLSPSSVLQWLSALSDAMKLQLSSKDSSVPTFHVSACSRPPTAPSVRSPSPSVTSWINYVSNVQTESAVSISQANKVDEEQDMPSLFWECIQDSAESGVSFAGLNVLITGCGAGSIGQTMLIYLLRGGAKVFATTSRLDRRSADSFRALYQTHGARGSALTLVPFNQASSQDVKHLVHWLYEDSKGPQVDLDIVIPFAALKEADSIRSLGPSSELSHRAMLTNTTRLVGDIGVTKERLGLDSKPTHCLLPLSPNHGHFGNDGLYAESKLGLEALMRKIVAENLTSYLSVCGAVIGWTRGTGLMNGNNLVAPGFEQELGVRTFSVEEMAFTLLACCHPTLTQELQQTSNPCLWADLSGRFAAAGDLSSASRRIRSALTEKSAALRLLSQESSSVPSTPAVSHGANVAPVSFFERRANPSAAFNSSAYFPDLSSQDALDRIAKETQTRNALDLSRVVVVVGFGETGPFGNARLRWQLESTGEFSLEGCLELAWLMGLIKRSQAASTSGWVDAKTNEPVREVDVKAKYESYILQHVGIRVMEPEMMNGYDANKKMQLQQVVLTQDMQPIEAGSQEEAESYVRELSAEHVRMYQLKGSSSQWMIQLRKGAVLYIPKAAPMDRFVASLLPTGWQAERLGLPSDLASSIDPATLYALAATCDALLSAGITDPYEVSHNWVHPSEFGNFVGGGIGGNRSIQHVYRERLLGVKSGISSDTLQEVFINVAAAWINMLLFSASGPVKTPVGACATAAASVDIAMDTIRSGKCKFAIVGAVDDIGEESSFEFGQMRATSDSKNEVAHGREPSEMSRPASSSRSGFMESHGAGIQLLTTAEIAIARGLPIYGIIASSNTAMDKQGRSVPAPGQGILSTAREVRPSGSAVSSPLLDISYRRQQLESERHRISEWARLNRLAIAQQYHSQPQHSVEEKKKREEQREQEESFVQKEAKRLERAALATWSHEFYVQDESISPLRGALATYGLSLDDIEVATFHGTSTKANDLNESQVTCLQLQHLGRSQGCPLYTIFQKHLTGHPKGSAAAWMLNGLMQSMLQGVVPGNKNLDDVDIKLRSPLVNSKTISPLVFTDRPIRLAKRSLRAGLLKSFGFGQAGAELLVLHPDFVLASLSHQQYSAYESIRSTRERISRRATQDVLYGRRMLIQVKNRPPYDDHDPATSTVLRSQQSVLLDPTSRASFAPNLDGWRYLLSTPVAEKIKPATAAPTPALAAIPSFGSQSDLLEALNSAAASSSPSVISQGLGVDVETVDTLSLSQTFLLRNFRAAEVLDCLPLPLRRAAESMPWTELAASISSRLSATASASASASSSSLNEEGLAAYEVRRKLTGRWTAKEAVIKAITDARRDINQTIWQGGAAPLCDVEIRSTASGAPSVILHEAALQIASSLGVNDVSVSISYTGGCAAAISFARGANVRSD